MSAQSLAFLFWFNRLLLGALPTCVFRFTDDQVGCTGYSALVTVYCTAV